MMVVSDVLSADREFFGMEGGIGIVPRKKENSFFLGEGYKSMRKSAQDNKKAALGGLVVGMATGYGTSELIQHFNANQDVPSEVIKKNKYELAGALTFIGGLLGGVSVVGFFCKQAGKKEGIEIGRKEEILKRIQEYKEELKVIEREDLTPDAKNAAKSRVIKFLNKEEEAYNNIGEERIYEK